MATSVASVEAWVHRRGMAAIAAALAAANYSASPWLYEQLPAGTRGVGHLAYACAVVSTGPQGTMDRQRSGSVSLNVKSDVRVRVMARLRADNAVADYRTALLADHLVRQSLIGDADGSGGSEGPQKWRWTGTTRRVVADGEFHLSELAFEVWHQPNTTSL